MNGPFQVAQANIAGQTPGKPPARIVKVAKPFSEQSVVLALSYDGSVQADLTAIAGEKITLVHIGEKLIILFDNKSTVTLEPFFDSTGKPLESITVEVSPGRALTGTEFAALFPVTEDPSILPAAGDGDGNGAQASGANFSSVGVDPLALPNPLALLGQEELPNFVITNLLTPNFIDDTPTASDFGLALDEDEIPNAGGNPGGVNDINAPASFSGIVPHGFGLDLAGDINFASMDGQSQAINGITVTFAWDQASHTLTANDGTNNVFNLVVTDPTTGAYTVTLLHALHHHTDAFADNTETSNTFNLVFTIVDGNGTAVDATLSLEINDDAPLATENGVSVSVNENDIFTINSIGTSPFDGHTELATGAALVTGTLAGTMTFGADGPGAVQFGFINEAAVISYMESLNLFSKQTALPENGKELTYQLVGNVLTASEPDPQGNVVFTLTVNTDGTFEFRLFDELIHMPGNGENTDMRGDGGVPATVSIPFIQFGNIIAAFDGDGDGTTLGANFKITIIDDVPQVHIVNNPLGIVQHDETPGVQALEDTNDAAVKGLFSGVVNPGDDPDVANNGSDTAIGYARSLLPVVVALVNIGADSPAASQTLSLQLVQSGQLGGANLQLDSGLTTTEGNKVVLVKEGNLIVGRVLGTGDINGVDQTDPAAFAISIGQDGRVSIVHYLSLHHPDTASNDEAVNLDSVALDGLIAAQISVTDSDGDTATAFVEIGGNIRFDDDGPAVSIQAGATSGELAALAVNLDETVQPNGATNPSYDRTLGLEPQDANGGADDVDPTSGALYNRTPVASIAPTANQAIGHKETAAGLLDDLFNAPVINFGADGPAAGGGVSHLLSLVLSSASVATTLHVTALSDNALLQGLSFADRIISLVKVSDTVIEGRIPGANHALGGGDDYIAFRITLTNAGDPANAKISIDQFLPIDHGGTENPSVFDEQALLTPVGNGTLALKDTVTVTDGDGDPRTASAQVTLVSSGSSFISFDDDGPLPLNISAANGAANGLFFDGFVPNNDTWGAGSGINNSGIAGAWTVAASTYEGASTIQLERVGDNYRGSDSPTNSVMVDLEATPGNVQVSQNLPSLTAGALYHLTFEIGAANDPGITNSAKVEVFWNGVSVGIYTPTSGVMQTISIDVTAIGGNNALTFREIGEAGDNTGTFLANVKLADVIIIDETKGLQADSDDTSGLGALFATVVGPVGVDLDMDQPQYAQGQHSVVVLGAADFGTDGPAATNAVQIGLSVSSAGVDSGLTTTEGKVIHLYAEGPLVVGRFDADNNGSYETAAFALSIDPNGGILSIAQYVSLHHPDIHNNDEGVYLAPGTVLATVTLTDGDGDHRTTSADISGAVRFEDDGPSIDPLQNSSLRDWTVDEDVLPAAGHAAPVGNDAFDTPADTNDYTQLNDKPLGVTWGADGPKALTFAATDAQHPTIVITDQNGGVQPPLTSGGVALVYDIATNPDGGQTLIAYKGSISPANEVFKLTLDPDAGSTGTFSFELTGALDHPTGSGQNTLNLRFDFTATDGDGDAAPSFLTMRITDDVPYLSNEVISRTVDEDDIDTPWSQGTSQNDGDADGSITENSTGAAFVSGSLSGLVSDGADVPGKFAFAPDAVAQLLALGLFSKETAQGNGENGKLLTYATSNGPVGSNEIVITGNEPNPQGNPVFSLTLNTVTGAYEFRLFDELIHMPGDGQNDDLRSGQPTGNPPVQASVPFLNFGSIITYTDYDGDTVNLGGKFTITITDDVPHADIDIGRGSLTADETPGNQADDTTSSSVRNLFRNLENSGIVGDDLDVGGDRNGNTVAGNGAIAYAHSNFAIVVDDSTIGSDSPPYPHQYSLSVAGAAFSGLYVTDGSPINLSVNADGLVIGTVVGGAFNGKVAFAIAIESDGEVSVAQYLSIKHDDRGDPNETNDNGNNANDASPDDPLTIQQTLDGKIVVTLTVTDSDGDQSTDTVNIGKLITFLDDGPSVSSNSTVVLEDDDLAGGNSGGPGDDNAPENASDTLNHNYGADGPGSTLLTGVNVPTGSGFTSTVAPDGLSLVIAQNGVDVLKVTLTDTTNGNYTVTQLHAIDHPALNGQSGDDTENNVQFTVNYRVTDGDGDFANGTLKIDIDDDTPEPNFVLKSGTLVTHDETSGNDGPNDSSSDFASLFSLVTNKGNDPDVNNAFEPAIGYAQSTGAAVTVTPNYGADVPGSTVFSIGVPGSTEASGVSTTSGRPITLFEVNSTLIVGRYDAAGGTVTSSDPVAFAIHIDAATGVVTVVQYVSLFHPNASNPDDAVSITNGALQVTATVTDHDGDSVDQEYNIGSKIVFEDDGPSILIVASGEGAVVLTTQDADTIGVATDTAVSAANFSGVFTTTASYGADGGGSTNQGYSLAVTGPVVSGRVDSNLDSHGVSIYLYNVGGTIVGSTALTSGGINTGNTIFSVSVNGSGTVTLTQFSQIDHPIGSDPSAPGAPFDDQYAILGDGLVSLTKSGTITDGDSDTATSSATIDLGGNVRFTDDGPLATTTAMIKVDEDDLAAGNHDNAAGDDLSANVTGNLGFTAGADTPAIIGFVSLHGLAVFDTGGAAVKSAGVALTYFWDAGSNTLYASTDTSDLAHAQSSASFNVELTNPSTGAYSFSLLGQVDHPGHDDPGVAGTQTAFEDNININLTYTVTDFDGDTATGTLSISIDDDMPVIGASPVPANLILNGSFEDHGFVNNPGFDTFDAIDHWMSGPDNIPFEIQQGNIGDLPPQDGNAKVELDSDPINNPTSPVQLNATIQQTISTPLTAGDIYELSFWYSPRPSDGDADSSSLNVYWNGVVVHTIDSSAQTDGWQHISVLVTAQGGSNTVAFQGDGQENRLGAYLDNVSLVPAIFVDEDGLGAGTLSQGNNDSQPGDNVVPNTEGGGLDNNEATATGNLNIKWGADNIDSGIEGVSGPFNSFVQDQPNGVGDRSVTFANANVSVTGVPTLYSNGDLVTFELNADHTVLSGKADGRTVFEVSLTDEDTGKFRFVLLDQLDHAPGNHENDIGLSFNFTATDSDGDAVNGTFVVGVDDDAPVANDDSDSVSAGPITVVNFDDIPLGDGAETVMPAGYAGFTWAQAGVYNPGLPGYAPHSGENLAFIGEANGSDAGPDYPGVAGSPLVISRGTDFTPVGGWFSATFTNGLPITFQAYDDGNSVGTYTVYVNQGGPTFIDFTAFNGFTSIDRLEIDTPNSFNGFGGYFGLDDFSYRNDTPVATGNVVTGVDGGLGSDANASPLDGTADNIGADGFASIAWTGASVPVAGLSTIAGLYGTLTVDALGNYSYKLDDSNPAVVHWAPGDTPLADTFNYAIADGDGDIDTAKLTINVEGADDGVGLFNLTPAINGGDAVVNEDDLADGSSPNAAALTQIGTFNFSAPDGVDDLTVGGAQIVTDGVVTLPGAPIATTYGLLTITGVNLATGTVSYSYTLTDNTATHPLIGEDSLFDSISVILTDRDGDLASSTLAIQVIDDVPTAYSNTNSVIEGGTVGGNVLTDETDDVFGADGAILTVPAGGVVGVRAAGVDLATAVLTGTGTQIDGLYGKLTLNADGTYSYDGNPNAVLPAGASDVFVYTIKDGDGDASTTTLTINLTDSWIAAANDSDVTVYEKALDLTALPDGQDLAIGTVTGSLPGSALETDATSNQLTATSSVAIVSYELVTGGNAATAGAYGTIQVASDGSYIYTLTKPVTGPQADDGANTEVVESFQYKATDANGNTAFGTITVNVVDDVPTVAIDNSGAADPTTVAEAGTIAGDWSLTPGADGVLPADFKVSIDGGAPVAVSVGTAINTGKGLLTFNANGTWTFVAATNLDNDLAQSVTFALSAKDGDGDTATDSHTISITDGTNPSLSGGGLSLQMDDQNLSDGSTPSNPDFATGSVSFTAGSDALTNFAFAAGTGALAGGLTWNRVSNILIEGWDGAVGTGTKIVALALTPGSIAVGATGSVTVTATLVNNYDSHPGVNLDDLAALGSIGVVASDHDGDSVAQTVTLSVSDDLPALNIVDTPATVNEGQTINGTWTLAPGADGVTSVDVTVGATTHSLSLTPSTNVVTFNFATGTLTVDADLQWHFTANSVTSNEQVTFTIKATDGDNDTSSDSQTITILNVIQPLVIAGAITGVVEEEHGLPGGIDDTTSGTPPTNLDTDVVGDLNNVTNVISGSFGTLVSGGIDGTLSYSFAPLSGNPALNTVATVANGPLTSDGKPVLFAMDGGNLIGYVNSDGGTGGYSSATDTKIFTVMLDSTSGAYSFTLNARIDHPIHNDSTEDAIAINLNGRVTVTDSGGPAPADTNVPLNASVTVIDDTPVAVSESAVVNEGQKPTMNVVFVIDTSGSMGTGADSRMELAKAAAINLLNNSSVDFNQIMVVSFASGASHNTPIWADEADAISYISGLSANGNTDYDAALERVTTNWGSGPTAADQTVVYFISDGEPTDDNGTGTIGIVGAEQTAWETFLASKGVAASYAVGISTGVNDADLTPIAWAPGNPGLPPVIITSAGDLSTTLTGSLPGSVSGNVLANGDGFGADTGHIKAITVNGTTYTFDGNATIATSGNAPGAGDVINANGKQITIVTNLGGKLVFNFAANGTNQAGEWDYTAPNNINTTSPESFVYTLVDDDGDAVQATLSLTVNNINAAPSGINSLVTALEDTPLILTAANFGFTDPNDSPGNTLQAVKITTLETAGFLKLNGADVTLGQVISAADINAGLLTFTGAQNANGAAYASFTFQVQDNGGTANGGVDLDQSPNTMTINVTAVNDTPVAAASQGTYSATEQVNLNLHGTGLSINDTADGNSGSMTVTLSVGEGTLTVAAGNSGVTAGNIVGSGTSSVTITGTVTQINNLLAGTDTNGGGSGSGGTIVYNDNTNTPSASTTLTLLVNDNGNTGIDPGLTGTASNEQASVTATINIAAVNDAPSLVVHDGQVFNVQDQFNSASYSLNTGSASWSSNWTENGETSTSPTAGAIQIMDDPGISGTNLTLRLGDNSDNTNGDSSIQRSANLAGATSATLSFDYRQASPDNGEDLIVQAWNGSAFIEIGRIDGSDADGSDTFSINLGAAYISSNTIIRLVVEDDLDSGEYYYVDNVNINYTLPPTFTENGAAVVLDSSADVSDPELDAANNYNGATLTLARDGGASTQDQFGASGTLLFSGGNVILGGVNVGSLVNANGTLVITFNANATSTRVDQVLQQLTYANSSDTPPASVQIDYTFSDGNSGSQGTGGALSATGSITVIVNAVNDAPVAGHDNVVTNASAGTAIVIPMPALLVNDSDPEGQAISVNFAGAVQSGGVATLSSPNVNFTHTAASGSFSYTASDGLLPSNLQTVGVATIAGATFAANAASQILIGNNAASTYQFSTNDGIDAIRDLGGVDAIQITTAVASLLDFERTGNHLSVNVDQTTVTVYDHYNSQPIETVAFNAGGTAYGFSLGTGTYNLLTGLVVATNNTSDIVAGTSSGETLAGGTGTGTDLLFGNGGDDTLNATGTGNHLLVGGTGTDTLNGGSGNDVYGFDLTDGTDTITDTGGTDAIFVRTLGAALNALNAFDSNTGTGDGNLVIQYDGQQVTVNNHFDSDTPAVETISFDGGSAYGYDLGTTSYTINNDDPGNSGGFRTVSVASGDNFIAGENGTPDLISGGNGKDLLFGGTQNDTLNGGAGNDLLVGSAGNDTLNGGANDDVLVGGIGNDILDGGTGLDRFFYGETGTADQDTINNYSGTGASKDVIDISALLDAAFGPTLNIDNFIKVTDTGANALVQIDATGTGNFANAGNISTLTGYGTLGNIVSVYLDGAEHQIQVTA